ncbi:MAG: hypothetical protein CEE38_13940 [Planctomycetes bacterium B3_Pla]|nr:MAG: hypothetical protein CEE38_13940 [Planctomycetes bacterium B3_Pla]
MDELKVLNEQVERLTKLVALGVIGEKSQNEQIALLAKVGIAPKDIAQLIGTTPNTVRVQLSTMRKRKKKKG